MATTTGVTKRMSLFDKAVVVSFAFALLVVLPAAIFVSDFRPAVVSRDVPNVAVEPTAARTVVPTATVAPTTAPTPSAEPTATPKPIAPPASGIYIVEPAYYASGKVIYGKDVGRPEMGIVGVAYNLPTGAEVRAAFDGVFSNAGRAVLLRHAYNEMSADQSAVFPPRSGKDLGFSLIGDSLQAQVADQSQVKAGGAIALVSDETKKITLGVNGEFNVVIMMTKFSPDAKLYLPDANLLRQFFTFVELP